MYHSCTWPAASCCAATAVMWRRAHRRYTGWSRPQSAACVPLLFTPCRAAAELIWLNSFGRAVSTHIFDAITRYEALNLLAARSPRRCSPLRGVRNKFALHMGAPREPAHLWPLPAVTHVAYPTS